MFADAYISSSVGYLCSNRAFFFANLGEERRGFEGPSNLNLGLDKASNITHNNAIIIASM